MTRAQRIVRYFRWHGARLADGKYKIVVPPGADGFTGIYRNGDTLVLYPPFSAPVVMALKPSPKRKGAR